MQKQGRGKAGGKDKGKAGDDAEAESEETKLLCAVGDTCELCGAWNTIDMAAPQDLNDRSTPELNYAYLLNQVLGQGGIVHINVSFLMS